MNKNIDYKSIKLLIREAKTKDAIDRLLESVKGDDTQTVYSFSERFSSIKLRELRSELTTKEAMNELSTLTGLILSFIEQLREKEEKKESESNANEVFTDFNINNLIDLLSKSRSFSKRYLIEFCEDTKGFSELRLQLNKGMLKNDIAYNIVMYADDNGLIDPLLKWAETSDPSKFIKYEVLNNENGPSILNELYGVIVQFKRLLPEQRKPLILISGGIGTGKSSTINRIVGREIAPVGHMTKGTVTDSTYEFSFKDANLDFIDVPGLGESEHANKIYNKIYRDWAVKSDVIMVVVNPGRPAYGVTLDILKLLSEENVSPNKIVFGLNKVGSLVYRRYGKTEQVSVNNLLGPNTYELKEVEKQKVQFIKDLNEQIPGFNFRIDQVVAYDALTGWNIQKLLTYLIRVLPINTAIYYHGAAIEASNELRKLAKNEDERLQLVKEEEEAAEKISSIVFKFLKGMASKVNSGFGDRIDKIMKKPKKIATSLIKYGKRFLDDFEKIINERNDT